MFSGTAIEVAEAAGSTWFVDNNWDNLNKHCVCYMHIDSTGVKETELYEIKASEELLGFAKKNINDVLPELELRAMALKKIGDQSFMGIGVSSITQRKSFTKEYMEHAHGATLGWWNHTIEDGEDKCDPVALEEDTRATLKVLYDLATAKLLPYDFSDKISAFRANVQKVADKFGDHMDFTDLQDNLKTVEHQVNEIQAMKEGLSNEQAKLYNEFVKMVARQITNVTMTCADKYSQDSYGYYDIAAIGYLHAVQRYFTEKSLHRYRFSTIAWRSMNSSLNTFRRQEQRRQSHEFSYQAAHPPPDDAFDALRARLLLHDLFLLADKERLF